MGIFPEAFLSCQVSCFAFSFGLISFLTDLLLLDFCLAFLQVRLVSSYLTEFTLIQLDLTLPEMSFDILIS